MLTARDLILRVTAKGFVAASTQVGSAMTSPFIAVVFEDADLVVAERLMIQYGIRNLVVIRRENYIVSGILGVDDFARAGFLERAGEVLVLLQVVTVLISPADHS